MSDTSQTSLSGQIGTHQVPRMSLGLLSGFQYIFRMVREFPSAVKIKLNLTYVQIGVENTIFLAFNNKQFQRFPFQSIA